MFEKKYKYSFGRLEITVFITGMVVMILEMVGARVLAPHFGNSIFVWTSIIGIILASLSFGYYYGGRLSDKHPKYNFFGAVILLAGVAVFLTVLFKDFYLEGMQLLGIKWGSVLASIIIFAPASILLGMVSPFAARLKIKELQTSGATVGYLYALSTLGSILGTFLAGFYLISWLGNSLILAILSLVLVIVSILAGRFKNKLALLIIFLLAIIMVFLTVFQQKQINKKYLLAKDTAYNHLRILDGLEEGTNKDVRLMLMGKVVHSAMYLKEEDELASDYTRYYRLDALFKKNINETLMVGGGGYSVPRDFLKRFPSATIDVVEIDPGVTEVARDFFRLEPDSRMNIFHADGRIFLNNNKKKYDVIYMDAFGDYFSIPHQLTTIETAKRIFDSLEDDGVVLINIISALEGEKSKLVQAEYKNYSTIFPQVFLFGVQHIDRASANEEQNIMLVASKSTNKINIDDLRANASIELQEYLDNYYEPNYNFEEIKILTDEFSPVENYVMEYL